MEEGGREEVKGKEEEKKEEEKEGKVKDEPRKTVSQDSVDNSGQVSPSNLEAPTDISSDFDQL